MNGLCLIVVHPPNQILYAPGYGKGKKLGLNWQSFKLSLLQVQLIPFSPLSWQLCQKPSEKQEQHNIAWFMYIWRNVIYLQCEIYFLYFCAVSLIYTVVCFFSPLFSSMQGYVICIVLKKELCSAAFYFVASVSR